MCPWESVTNPTWRGINSVWDRDNTAIIEDDEEQTSVKLILIDASEEFNELSPDPSLWSCAAL